MTREDVRFWVALTGFLVCSVGWLVMTFIVVVCALVASGCGASAIRTHATIAHELHGGLEIAGSAILQAEDRAIARCPDADGDARSQCLASVRAEMTSAGALRDSLIAPVDTYRALTLSACGIDPSDAHAVAPADCPDPPPAVMAQIEAAAPAALHDVPVLIAALRALGVPIPAGLLGGGQ